MASIAPFRSADATSLSSREAAVARARQLAVAFRERAATAESERRIPDQSIAELVDSGLFHILTPKVLGGTELGFATLVDVTAELASACGSTGWVYGVLAGHSWLLHLFPERAQREVFADPNALTATVFRLAGSVEAVDGGFRITGATGRFCSGIDFASWVLVGGAVTRAEGTQEPRFFLVPRTDLVVEDDWFTAGMRGTGSRSVRIAEAFVPSHRSVTLAEMQSGAAPGTKFIPGPLYRFSFAEVTPFSIVGAPLGMAKGALASIATSMGKSFSKSADSPEAIIASNRLGGCATEIEIACTTVLADAEKIDRTAGSHELPALDRIRISRNWAYAVQTARRAVNALFEQSGGSVIYDSTDMQRFWRDINAASQHRAFTWNFAMTDYGRALLGFNVGGYKLKS